MKNFQSTVKSICKSVPTLSGRILVKFPKDAHELAIISTPNSATQMRVIQALRACSDLNKYTISQVGASMAENRIIITF